MVERDLPKVETRVRFSHPAPKRAKIGLLKIIIYKNMKDVKIYSTPSCHFCHDAKDFFKANNIAFTDYDVSQDLEKRKEMVDLTDQMGVPVIVVDGQWTVGFNKREVAKMLGLI